ncbi:MAG: hypothetical protein ABIQ08_06630 [Duganella sp.]
MDETTGAITQAEWAIEAEKSAAANEEHGLLVAKLGEAARAPSATSFDALLNILDHMETEVQLTVPNVIELQALFAELQKTMVLRLEKAARDVTRTGETEIFGINAPEEIAKFLRIATKINYLAAKKVARINALTAPFLEATNQTQKVDGAQPPPPPPVDNKQGAGMMAVRKPAYQNSNLLRKRHWNACRPSSLMWP